MQGDASLFPRPSLDLPAFNVAHKSWEIERGPGNEVKDFVCEYHYKGHDPHKRFNTVP